jgi:hypothetical protein
MVEYILRGIIICKLLMTHKALRRYAWNVSNTWGATIIIAN